MVSTQDSGFAAPPHVVGSRRILLRLTLATGVVVVLGAVVAIGLAIRAARRAAIASAAQGPLNQLQLALHNYHDTYGQFPPAYVTDAKGAPIHSWRALILPFIEEQSLYEAYDFAEPWNGPNNAELADQMPKMFWTPGEEESHSYTNIVAITGPGTAFPGDASTTLADFLDGPENTILLTEVTDSKIPWLSPADLDVRDDALGVNRPGAIGISSVPWRRPYVVFADAIHAYAVRDNTPLEALRALMTIAGGEPVTRQSMISQGYLQ